MKTKWHSLTDVKTYIENNTKEKILSFNGYRLETNQYVYMIAHGILSRQKRSHKE